MQNSPLLAGSFRINERLNLYEAFGVAVGKNEWNNFIDGKNQKINLPPFSVHL
jgi:hypothetical protein